MSIDRFTRFYHLYTKKKNINKMERNLITPREDWKTKLEKLGFVYHSLNCTYWDESVSYSFNMN